ncbi:MAG: adenylyl-sulfate kinase [Lachnospiraceae bacterium]
MEKGTVYWITGLSGAGKTTIGTLLFDYLKNKKDNVVMLDGDIMRKINPNNDYTIEGRDRASYTNLRLCQFLSDQNIDVVACFIGMYDRYRDWNRENIENYMEIYLKVSMEDLIKRDAKGLYKKAINKEIQNVYGIDLAYEEPKNADIVIENDWHMTPEEILHQIIEKCCLCN